MVAENRTPISKSRYVYVAELGQAIPMVDNLSDLPSATEREWSQQQRFPKLLAYQIVTLSVQKMSSVHSNQSLVWGLPGNVTVMEESSSSLF